MALDPITGDIIQYDNEEYVFEDDESYEIYTEDHLEDEFLYKVKFSLMLKEFVRQTKGTQVNKIFFCKNYFVKNNNLF